VRSKWFGRRAFSRADLSLTLSLDKERGQRSPPTPKNPRSFAKVSFQGEGKDGGRMLRLMQTPFRASRVLQNRARLAPLHLPPQLNAGAGNEKTFARTRWVSDRQEGKRRFSCKITKRTQLARRAPRVATGTRTAGESAFRFGSPSAGWRPSAACAGAGTGVASGQECTPVRFFNAPAVDPPARGPGRIRRPG
jgi:hypothetical protein